MENNGSGATNFSAGDALEQNERPAAAPPKNARQRAAERSYSPEYEKPPRRPAAEREHAFNMFIWLLEGASGLIEELRRHDLGLSEDFWVHVYAARKESLLATRAFIDSLIERSEQQVKQEQERQQRQERRGGVPIDFSDG
jgi:hypothetical protein